jgi:hypothetical protein
MLAAWTMTKSGVCARTDGRTSPRRSAPPTDFSDAEHGFGIDFWPTTSINMQQTTCFEENPELFCLCLDWM